MIKKVIRTLPIGNKIGCTKFGIKKIRIPLPLYSSLNFNLGMDSFGFAHLKMPQGQGHFNEQKRKGRM